MQTWISPLKPLAFDEATGILQLEVSNPVKSRVVTNLYHGYILDQAKTWFKRQDISVELVLPNRGAKKAISIAGTSTSGASNGKAPGQVMLSSNEASKSSLQVIIDGDDEQASDHTNSDKKTTKKAATPSKATQHIDKANLHSDYTFESLVIGKSNELAAAAARHIAEHPGASGTGNNYNPFYLYGSTGLGKTHIMHAIGNYVRKAQPELKIRYTHANDYIRGMVNAFRRNVFEDWQREYNAVDLLLIDDIQFFRSKDRTQEIFFYLFETMVANNKQIVISSDTFPRELKNMEQRLITRFSMGLSLSLEPPEIEMRVAILQNKVQTNADLVLGDDAAFFIAKHVRSNVRELEGALTKVMAFAKFQGKKELTVELCREALRDLLNSSISHATVDNIKRTVAEYYKVKLSDLDSKRRHASIVLPRQVAMYLCKELTSKSLPNIGEQFGGRNHTTVMHACKKIKGDRINDTELNHQLHVLEQSLKG